jgi:hypothetical protein
MLYRFWRGRGVKWYQEGGKADFPPYKKRVGVLMLELIMKPEITGLLAGAFFLISLLGVSAFLTERGASGKRPYFLNIAAGLKKLWKKWALSAVQGIQKDYARWGTSRAVRVRAGRPRQ